MKLKKVAMILIIICLICNTACLATDMVQNTIDTGDFKPTDLTKDDYGTAFEMAGTLVNIFTTTGILVAILGIIVLGIKYITGSVEEKAEYKKTMIPYLIGCIFIFATTTMVSIIYNMVTQIQV